MAIDRTHLWRWLLGCAAVLAAPAALAQSSAPGWWFQLGAFRPTVDTTLRVDDAGGGNGTQFDAESVLGLPKRRTLASGLIGVRLGDRWRLEVEHFKLNRSVRQFAITDTVVIDDTTFPVSALVDSDFDSALPEPQQLPADLVAEGHTIPIARVVAMHEGKRRKRAAEQSGEG